MAHNQNRQFPGSILMILLSLGLLIFVGFKAGRTSFTHDESYTYLHYVPQTFVQIVTYQTPFTNNHILNTLMMKWFSAIFGVSEWALRLPNILAFVIFLYFGVRILQKVSPSVLIPTFVLLVFNPYLLDYFGLARGYGLSFAFMTMAFYYLIHYFEKEHCHCLVWMNLGVLLAILSNFTMLFFYGSLLILFNLMVFLSPSHPNTFRDFLKVNRVQMIFLVLIGIVITGPLIKTLKMVPLNFGGKTGLLHDTMRSVVIMSYFGINEFWTSIITWGCGTLVLILFVSWIVKLWKIPSGLFPEFRTLILANGLIINISLLILAGHSLLGLDFPIQRFALFFFPILIWNVGAGLELLFRHLPKLTILLGMVLVVMTLWNFTRQVNLKYYRDWAYDADTREAITAIVKDHEKNRVNGQAVHVGVSWIFEPTMNFYRLARGLDWMEPINREKPGIKDDYVYILKDEYPDMLNAKGRIIFDSEQAGSTVLKFSFNQDMGNDVEAGKRLPGGSWQ